MRALLVDDSLPIRKIVEGYLKELNFTEIIHAQDGAAALAILERDNAFSCLFSDWNMPEMTGYELLLAVRESDSLRTLPFVMMTTEGELRDQALAAGASHFIKKPFEGAAFKREVRETLENLHNN